MYYNNKDKAINYVKELRAAGVNTVYLSFDAVDEKINFKNHYEVPFIFEAFKEGSLTSVVLVPTLINGWNFPEEIGKIVRFAAKNMDVVRGVNFQPVSFVGYMSRNEIEEVEKKRVTISDLEKAAKEQLNIPRDAWKPIPFVVPLIKLLGKKDLGFYNNEKCGEATYVIVDKEKEKFYPITEYINVDKLYFDLNKAVNGNFQILRKFTILAKLFSGNYFIQEDLPDGTNLKKMLTNLFIKRDYSSAGELNYEMLYLGTMHFMDPFNYDVGRVMRCSIHYSLPNGNVVPFCAYNVFPSFYRDKSFKEYGKKDTEAKNLIQLNSYYYKEIADFRKKIKEIKNNSIYTKRYS